MTGAASRAARRRDLALAVALFATGFVYFGAFVHYGISIADEGALLAQFERLARGETLYVDFHAGYTPGVYFLHAATMRWFDHGIVPGRWLLVCAHAATLALLFLLARRTGAGRGFAALAALFYASLPPVHAGAFAASNVPYPVWYCVPLWCAGLLCVLRFRRQPAGRWLLAAGLLAGLGFLFKPNVGLFQLAAVSLLTLASLPPTPRARGEALLWWLWWGAALAGLVVVFAGAGARDLAILLAPALAAGGLVAWHARGAPRLAKAPRPAAAAAMVGAGFLAVNLPWMAYYHARLGSQRFLERVLFVGAGFERFYHREHPEVALAALGALALAAAAWLAARRLPAGRSAPLRALALWLAWLAGALLLVRALAEPFEEVVFALALVAHGAGLALWARALRAAPRDDERSFELAVLCVGASLLYLQIYPRTDFMHWVTAAPVSVLLFLALLERLAATWARALRPRVPTALVAAAALAPVALVVAQRTAASLDAVLDWHGPLPRRALRATLESEKAPIWINAGVAGHYGDLSATTRFLRERTREDERIFTFPALDLISFLSGRPNATRHAYFYPGWPGRDAEAEVIAALGARPPRFAVVANWNLQFFTEAALYYYALGDYLDAHYRPYARFGRYTVLAHRELGPDGAGPAYARPTTADALGPQATTRLRRALAGGDVEGRLAAIAELRELRVEDDFGPLTARLDDPEPRVRVAAVEAVQHTRDPGVALRAVQRLAEGEPSGAAAKQALEFLLLGIDRRAVRPLLASAFSDDEALAHVARRALAAVASHELLSSFRAGHPPRPLTAYADLRLDDAFGVRVVRWLRNPRIDIRLRLLAVWASQPLPDDEALPALRAAVAENELSQLGLRAMWALVQRGRSDELREPALRAFVHHDRLAPRVLRAVLASEPDGDRFLAKLLRSHVSHPGIAARAAWLAATAGGPRSAAALVSALDGPATLRGAAAWALGNIGAARHRAALERATSDPDVDVRELATSALALLDRRLLATSAAR